MNYSVACQVSGIADDILIVGFGEWGDGHDKMVEMVLYICRQTNLKHDKCLFRSIILGEIISWARCESRPKQIPSTTDMP